MQFDKNKYPLRLLQGVEELLKTFKKLEEENNDIIESVVFKHENKTGLLGSLIQKDKKSDEYIFKFIPKDKSLNFYFIISDPKLDAENKPMFLFTEFPYSDRNLRVYRMHNIITVIKRHFDNWITLLKKYISVNLTQENIFIEKYTQEFYEEFEIIDKDAGTNPFKNEQQIFIYKLLSYIESELKKSGDKDPKVQEIIADVKILQSNIQNLTKKEVVKKLSKIFAKIKQNGLKLFLDIIDVAKKEVIKKALYGGLDEIEGIIQIF
jgi:L-rhamnose mutarotase